MTVLAAVPVAFPIALAVRLATIGATLATARRAGLSRAVSMGGSIVASAITTWLAVQALGSQAPVAGVLLRHTASGIRFTYDVTPLSAWFLLVLGLIAIPIAIYSVGYFAHSVPASRMAVIGAAFNALLGAVETVFAAGDVLTLLFAWELMTLTTAMLVAAEHEDRHSRRAAYLYLVMSHVGTGCLVVAFFLAASASNSISLAAVLHGGTVAGPARVALFVLFFIGFGVKAGVIPLHVWLPDAHPAAPSSVSALMSAVLITTGLYGLLRTCAFGLGVPDQSWGLAFMTIGALTAVLGVLYALTQNDLKRMLAYSTIENTGIMLLGIGVGMMALASGRHELAAIAFAATLYHVLNHAAFKGLLFLAAGGIVMATGTRRIEEFGGLLRRMPWTGAFFLVGAVAISGLPPLNGFASEWLLFQALLRGFASVPGIIRLNFPIGGALLALTSALAAACFVKAFGISFLALPRSSAAAGADESPAWMLVPQASLAALCIGLGLFPGMVVGALGPVLASLPGTQSTAALALDSRAMASFDGVSDHVVPIGFAAALIAALGAASLLAMRSRMRRVPTWGCGGELTARSEYSATAFSKPLMMIFRSVYRPTREVEALADVSPYFPTEVRYRARIEPTFERYVYEPLTRTVLRVARGMKVLQAGSLHAYLAYVLVLGVLLLIWLGGSL